MPARRSLHLALGCLLATALQLALLKSLPYARARLLAVPRAATAQPPTPAGFALGGLTWPLEAYAHDARLQPLRDYFGEFCAGRAGLAAATCLSDVMAAQFPHSAPRREFVDAHYDPVADLHEHRAGAAGHCMTRAALVSATLLAVGVPARVTQVFAADGNGHNVLEVWDAPRGWVVVDPTLGGVVVDARGPISAAQAAAAPAAAHVLVRGPAPRGAPPVEGMLIFDGSVVYPEPWLYTRVGPRVAAWPFRAAFAHVGPTSWRLGAGQAALRFGSAASALLCLAWCGAAVAADLRRRASRRAPAARPGGARVAPVTTARA
jgi:hypothetical protein